MIPVCRAPFIADVYCGDSLNICNITQKEYTELLFSKKKAITPSYHKSCTWVQSFYSNYICLKEIFVKYDDAKSVCAMIKYTLLPEGHMPLMTMQTVLASK